VDKVIKNAKEVNNRMAIETTKKKIQTAGKTW
jgi:hypothetical protein